MVSTPSPRRAALAGLLTIIAAAVCASSAAADNRTWVSGVGDDANPCTRSAPCKTFPGAISRTDAGGEIDALDPGGFGAVTITKPITISGGGTTAGILVQSTNGIIINAPGDDITLRGIQLIGLAECPTATSLNGIRILGARSVTLQDVDIQQFGQAGVLVAPSASDTRVYLDHVRITDGCGPGVSITPTATGKARVELHDVQITGNDTGVSVAGDGYAGLLGSTVAFNSLGLMSTPPAVLEDLGGNSVANNTAADGSAADGSFTKSPPPPPTVTVTQTVTTPAPPPQTITVQVTKVVCAVPSLTGLTLKQATSALKVGHCAAGSVKQKKGSRSKRGRVVAQAVKAGVQQALGAKVALTVGS